MISSFYLHLKESTIFTKRHGIFRSWDWISIKYTAHAGLGLGWTRKTWQFDKNKNQQHILEIMNPILEKWRGMVVFGQSR